MSAALGGSSARSRSSNVLILDVGNDGDDGDNGDDGTADGEDGDDDHNDNEW